MKYGKNQKIYIIKAIYSPDENNKTKIRIIGNKFIKKNKDKCKIIYNNKKYELKEYFEDINNNCNHKDFFKLKLLFIYNIIDISNLFNGCDSLISLSDIKLNSLKSKKEKIEINCGYNIKDNNGENKSFNRSLSFKTSLSSPHLNSECKNLPKKIYYQIFNYIYLIWVIHFLDAIVWFIYQIFQIGILLMLII